MVKRTVMQPCVKGGTDLSSVKISTASSLSTLVFFRPSEKGRGQVGEALELLLCFFEGLLLALFQTTDLIPMDSSALEINKQGILHERFLFTFFVFCCTL